MFARKLCLSTCVADLRLVRLGYTVQIVCMCGCKSNSKGNVVEGWTNMYKRIHASFLMARALNFLWLECNKFIELKALQPHCIYKYQSVIIFVIVLLCYLDLRGLLLCVYSMIANYTNTVYLYNNVNLGISTLLNNISACRL